MSKFNRFFILIISFMCLFSFFSFGCNNPPLQGDKGEQGIQGIQGIQGENGTNGNSWLSGYTVPLNSLGVNSDFYLDLNSRDIYKKENDKWSLIGNMQGKEVKRKWDSDNKLKILAIGNSFSDDALWLLPDILKDLGILDFRVSNLFIGGCSIDTHLSNIKTQAPNYEFRTNIGNGWETTASTNAIDGILADDWDYITFQQASGYSGLPSTYSGLTELVNLVEALKPQAKLVWHMTWAYQQDTTHGNFADYGNDQTTMYNAIVNTAQEKVIPNLDFNFIVPNGTAIQNARTSWLGDTLTRDGYHLSYDIGRYIAGLSYAYTMTGYDISKIQYVPSGLNSGIKNICVESVLNAVKVPFRVKASSHTLNTDFVEVSNYGWTELACWNSNDPYSYTAPITGYHNSNQFICTKQFDKNTLPVGSIIEIDSNWQYRPDGWIGQEVTSAELRPGFTNISRVFVTDAWWGAFDKRAFNIAKQDLSVLTGIENTAKSAFRIFIPKK